METLSSVLRTDIRDLVESRGKLRCVLLLSWTVPMPYLWPEPPHFHTHTQRGSFASIQFATEVMTPVTARVGLDDPNPRRK